VKNSAPEGSDSRRLVKLLLDTGKANVESEDIYGNSYIALAGKFKQHKIVKLLRSHSQVSAGPLRLAHHTATADS
jgi:ankyrin repeat protein